MAAIEEVYAYLDENEPEIAQSICYASELLLSELDDALETLKMRRVEAAQEDNDAEYERLKRYRDVLKDYKKDINTYLNYTVKKDRTEIISDSDENKLSINYSEYKVDSNQPHLLSEDFTYTKICGFMFRRKKITVNGWKDALIMLCNKIAQISPHFFYSLIGNPDFQGRKVGYFSDVYMGKRSTKIQNIDVYVYTCLSANAIAKLMTAILNAFGEKTDEFYIYLKADYSSLHQDTE